MIVDDLWAAGPLRAIISWLPRGARYVRGGSESRAMLECGHTVKTYLYGNQPRPRRTRCAMCSQPLECCAGVYQSGPLP